MKFFTNEKIWQISALAQRYTYRVLQTIQIKLKLLCVWAEPAGLGSAKTAFKKSLSVNNKVIY